MKNNKSLSLLQNEIQQSILDSSLPHSLISIIKEKPPISISQRLKIYQNAFRTRLLESLKDDFTKVLSFTGEKEFEILAYEYIKKFPSRFQNLAEFSQDFPLFLKTKDTYLYELAIQDWISIESQQAIPPAASLILSALEITSNISYLIKKYPSSVSTKTSDKYFLAYNLDEVINVTEITETDFTILNFLSAGKTIEEISSNFEMLQLSEESFSKKISWWLENKIIYCERL